MPRCSGRAVVAVGISGPLVGIAELRVSSWSGDGPCLSRGSFDRQEKIMGSRTAPQRRRRIVVGGPLAPFADGLRRDLAGQGYALDTVGDHVHLLADLSDWLSGRGSDRGGPDERGGRAVLADAPRGRPPRWGDAAARSRRRWGICAGWESPRRTRRCPRPRPLDVLMAEYRHYLEGERGLSAGTVTHYLRCARMFLTWLPEPVGAVAAGAVGRAGHRLRAGLDREPWRQRGGRHGDPARAAFAAAVPARRGACSVVAGGSGPGRAASARERGRAAGGVG